MASNTLNTGVPLSPAEVKGMLAVLSNDLETCMTENSKLSEKLEFGLMEQKLQERMLQEKLDVTHEKLRVQEGRSEDRIIMQGHRLKASISKVAELENEIAELKNGMSGTFIELLDKIGKLERRISGMEDARHEQHEQSSNATDNVVIKQEIQ